ncbi:MAG: hypothetical protein K2W92_04845 [Alphaproteobacteria bacterium]|nr:hypothetical protein [Alphaproteobacteria bacterium]
MKDLRHAPEAFKEDLKKFSKELAQDYGVPSAVDTNSPYTMGHFGTKNGNLSQQSITPKTTKVLDFPVISC